MSAVMTLCEQICTPCLHTALWADVPSPDREAIAALATCDPPAWSVLLRAISRHCHQRRRTDERRAAPATPRL